ncbi:MAG: hypothetical protein ACI3X3_09320 [Acidaminococcus sp.]|uniref:OB-fold protein n=1 Tax=Acidaminococcus sp. TaxID=1872103 RepID=UPI003F1925C4
MKKWLGVVLVGILLIIGLVGCGGGSTKKQVSYADADITVLMNDVEKNAAAASKNYKGKDVKVINGVVSNIDADGKYFSIVPAGNKLSLKHMQCFIRDSKLKEQVTKLQKGAPVVVYGHIKDVGEIMGYSLDTDKFELVK